MRVELSQSKSLERIAKKAVKAFEALFKKGAYKPKDLFEIDEYNELIDSTSNIFNSTIPQDTPEEMKAYLQKDSFIFSALRTHSQLAEARQYLKDENGNVRPYHKFEQDILKINDRYNKNYLQAEYEFAIHSSQSATNWANLQDDTDRYWLEYRTAGDDKVREEHQALNRICLPKDDDFWKEYYPPNGWRCRCTAVEVIAKGKTKSDSQKAIEEGKKATTQISKSGKNKLAMFRFNPGLQNKMFPPDNAYTKVVGADEVKTEIEYKNYKLLSKQTLDYGRQHIIGKYQFIHEKFTASFVRNSFTENLRFGELFHAKVEILQNIKSYLESAGEYKFNKNLQKERKPGVLGYHTLIAKYKGNDEKLKGRKIEFQFEDREKQGVKFHFIKFIKKD